MPSYADELRRLADFLEVLGWKNMPLLAEWLPTLRNAAACLDEQRETLVEMRAPPTSVGVEEKHNNSDERPESDSERNERLASVKWDDVQ